MTASVFHLDLSGVPALLLLGAVLACALYAAVRLLWRAKAAGPPPSRLPLTLPAAAQPLSPMECLRRYVRHPTRYCNAEEVALLVDGRGAFPEMLAGIDAAQRSVDLETYMLRADATGARFQQALVRAAGRGARVRLTYDWIGSLGLADRFVHDLIEAGVDVRVYHPLALVRPPWAMNRRTHRKILLIDGRTAFTGGLNIADDYASIEDGGKGWRDTHLRVDGAEAARRMWRLFEYAWRRATPYRKSTARGARLGAGIRRRFGRLRWRRTPAELLSGPPCAAGVPVKVLGNEEFRYRRRIRLAYLHAIDAAQRYVLIENAYFIPTGKVRRALVRAARRGVVVAVVVTGHSDVPVTTYAMRHLYRELLEGGVRIFEWPQGMMHAKTAVIDDAWSIVGSYNFDHRSLIHQLEAAVAVADPAVARALCSQTLADIARCREVNLQEHGRRPWLQRVLEVLAYGARPWL